MSFGTSIYTISINLLCVFHEGCNLIQCNALINEFCKWVIFEKQTDRRHGVQGIFLISLNCSLACLSLCVCVFVCVVCVCNYVWRQIKVKANSLSSVWNFKWTWHFNAKAHLRLDKFMSIITKKIPLTK